VECPAGTYRNGAAGQQTAAAACTLCPIGRWSDSSGVVLTSSDNCILCPAGKVGLMDGAAGEAAGCAEPCTAVAVPALNGGGVGSCADIAAQGNSTCWQTCPVSQGLSGPALCSGTNFTSQSCKECKSGEVYTSLLSSSLLKHQQVGVGLVRQYQGYAVAISGDGRVMVQGAFFDDVDKGSQFLPAADGMTPCLCCAGVALIAF